MTDTLQRIADILQPIADQDWHGKWRILKVIELCSNKHLELTTIDKEKIAYYNVQTKFAKRGLSTQYSEYVPIEARKMPSPYSDALKSTQNLE